jgi:tetratricopeptide (TPR) repeat protein
VRSRLLDGRWSPRVTAAAVALFGAAVLRWMPGPPAATPPKRPAEIGAERLAPLPAAAIRDRRGEHPAADPTSAAFERGVDAYDADDLEAAMDAFEEAVRLSPDEPEAHINLGLVYLRLQRPEDAMRELMQGASLEKCRGHATNRPRRNRCSD